MHGDGSVETLVATFDSETGELTFVTDKFSTYAITYKDVDIAEKVDDTPKTGDTANPAAWLVLMLLGGLGLALSFDKRRRFIR